MGVSAELVAKVAAMRLVAEARASDDRIASSVLAQRGARVANAVAFAGGLAMWAMAALTALVSSVMIFIDGQEAGLPRTQGIGLVEASVCLVVLGAATWILAGRRALRLLTVGFGALAPERPGEPPACRRCGGPLPEPGAGSAVARCIYCSATNVMAADLRVEAAIVSRFGAFADDPKHVLADCAKKRRRARLLLVAGGAFGIWGSLSLARSGREPSAGPRTAQIPFVPAPGDGATTIEPGEGALRVERVARLGRHRVARLVPGDGATVDVVAQGESPGLFAARNVDRAPPRWQRLGGEIEHAWPPTYARTGAGALVFASRDGAVWSLAPDGTSRPMHTARFFEDRVLVDLAPGSSGTVLATTRASTEGHLRVRRIDPSGRTSVLVDDAREPALSPSGDRIAFAHLVGERFQIAVAPASKPSAVELLTSGAGHAAFPTWSPDGRRIAFLTRPVRDPIHFDKFEGSADLWVLDLEGHALRLTRGASLELAPPVWTSEGLWVLTDEGGEEPGAVVWRVAPK
jgi:hypothetical protein